MVRTPTTATSAGAQAHGGRARAVLWLLALVTGGWMAGIGIGIGQVLSDDASRVQDITAWLTPSLMGVLALAIVSVALALTAIGAGIGARARVMSGALPRLLHLEKE